MRSLLAALTILAFAIPAGADPTTQPVHVTSRGRPLTLVGTPPTTGETARPFTAVANDMSSFHFTPGDGQAWIIASVPSVDTRVCSIETRRFNEEAARLPGVKVLTISMDLPFAQQRWCAAEGIKNLQTVSDYKDRSFGDAWGVRIKENGLLARTVFVVAPDGTITYRQIVADISHEPDYTAAMDAARQAVQSAPTTRPATE